MNNQTQPRRVFVLMGVSGSGKSAVAARVAHELQTAFLDGDFLHPRRNIEKMASGNPLNDDDRMPWLKALNDAAYAMQRTNDVSLIICSSLKKKYRDCLREGNENLSFIYMKGDFDVIERRLMARKGHFQKPKMLESQFAALEEPGLEEQDVAAINIDQPLDDVVADVIRHIKSKTA